MNRTIKALPLAPLYFWYNYVTREYESRTAPTTDEEAMYFIPQHPGAQGIYQCHRALGHSVLESMIEAIEACIPAAELERLGLK